MENKTLLIAEAGVNHNGKFKLAKKMIEVASSCGADFVKFQIFKANNLVVPNAPKAKYQKLNTLSKKKRKPIRNVKKI